MGAWAEYRTSNLEAGRREEGLVRVQCVGHEGGAWELELLPLAEDRSGRRPEPGEGWSLRLADAVLAREGDLAALVRRVVRWRGGAATELAPAEWREDPLVSTSLRDAFRPQRVRAAGETVRVVAGRDLRCRQWELSAAETLRVRLPRGDLEQVTTPEVTAAAHADVPILGVAFATERTASSSRVVPPRPGRAAPEPTLRVEIMELLAFGDDARRLLPSR